MVAARQRRFCRCASAWSHRPRLGAVECADKLAPGCRRLPPHPSPLPKGRGGRKDFPAIRPDLRSPVDQGLLHLAAAFGLAALALAIVDALVWIILILPEDRSDLLSVTGRCPSCAYQLRGSPHQCPECGARVVAVVFGD